jgi:serine O-acetyltransferase
VSPERLWLLSIALRKRGHRRLARLVKRLNSALYRNSLPSTASVGTGLELGNRSLGTIVHSNVVIGDGVRISHNVTIAVRAGSKAPYKVVVEDDVSIGTNAVIITPHRADLRIGRGASVGPGAVVNSDVPAGASVLCAEPRTLDGGELTAPGQGGESSSGES